MHDITSQKTIIFILFTSNAAHAVIMMRRTAQTTLRSIAPQATRRICMVTFPTFNMWRRCRLQWIARYL